MVCSSSGCYLTDNLGRCASGRKHAVRIPYRLLSNAKCVATNSLRELFMVRWLSWLKAAVCKTVMITSSPGVRIPLAPQHVYCLALNLLYTSYRSVRLADVT